MKKEKILLPSQEKSILEFYKPDGKYIKEFNATYGKYIEALEGDDGKA